MEEIEKQYYRIGEVARELGVNTSLIRFWEEAFPEIKPGKNRRKERLYTPADLQLLREIYHLVKERGHTLPGAREELKRRRQDQAERAAVVKRLRELRAFLVEMRDQLPEA
ncbi:MAG: MerR family transcriptional regulator [Catalinimonas sp.]